MLQVLDGSLWRAYAKEHERRSGRFADPFTSRRERGQAHPVEDFLFTYYTLKPGQFKRWHPGAGVILLDAAERANWKFYRAATEDELLSAGLSPTMHAPMPNVATRFSWIYPNSWTNAAPPSRSPAKFCQIQPIKKRFWMLWHARMGDGV